MFTVEVKGLTELILRFDTMGDRLRQKMSETMGVQVLNLQTRVIERMQSLFNNPQKMIDSLSTDVSSTSESVIGTVSASGLPYLAAQEFGVTFQMPELFKSPGVMAFVDPGRLNFNGAFNSQASGMVFTHSTRAHPITLPERSFMRSALAMEKAAIIQAFRDAVAEAL